MSIRPFHLAFPVNNLAESIGFYKDMLGCSIGRQSDQWVDFNFFGHQITAHLCPANDLISQSEVDGHAVPVRHFGIILDWADWETLAERLKQAKVPFLIQPYLRFQGEAGEQSTFFIKDPSGNYLEFKAFRDDNHIFRT